ncbi:MAG: Fic family protein [Bdellovibrionales bacterium]|nr:Fic family protein [Bdellovibrionales bacterium]
MSEVTFNRETLRLQLERARFERALEVCESMVDHRVLLTNSELARLNNILTGHQPTDDPWRQGPMTATLRSGRQVQFSVMADPKVSLRDCLHQATELAESGHIIDAAVELYVKMVLSHYFQDANRRTAVLAAHYFLKRYGTPISGVAIHEMGLGDIRDPDQIDALRQTLRNMAKLK